MNTCNELQLGGRYLLLLKLMALSDPFFFIPNNNNVVVPLPDIKVQLFETKFKELKQSTILANYI